MDALEKIPNLFLVGAPKCGTTAMHEYLAGHPEIFMSAFKEPHYFYPELGEDQNYISDKGEYLKLFAKTKKGNIILGESSVFYIYSKKAHKRIKGINKKAKVVVMLRNPIDLIYSFHNQMLFNGVEADSDFESSWRSVDEKLERELDKGVRLESLIKFNYKEIGSLGKNVDHLLTVFPREDVHFILFDDLKKSTLNVYSDILSFLGLEYDGKTAFPKVNESKKARFAWMRDFFQNPPWGVTHIRDGIKKFMGVTRTGFATPFLKLTTQKHDRPPLSQRFREELVDYYEEDVKLLGILIERDLNGWINKSESS